MGLDVNVRTVKDLMDYLSREVEAGRLKEDTIVGAPDYDGAYNPKGSVKVTHHGVNNPWLTVVGQWADYREED